MKRIIAVLSLCLMLATPAGAGFDEATVAHDRGDYATALREWRQLALQGDAAAQFNLGVMYALGEDVGQDDAQAIKCYSRAAAQDNGAAQARLGQMYITGEGVRRDLAQAGNWPTKSLWSWAKDWWRQP